jgi:hypothetical protein
MKAVQLVIMGAIAMAASPIMAFEANVGVDGSVSAEADVEDVSNCLSATHG